MRLPGNCLLAALVAKALAPRRVRIRKTRDRRGNLHFYWERDGERFEFYTKGASQWGLLRRAFRLGTVRRIGGAR